MPSKRNIQALQDLKDKISKSKSLVLSDYRGLTVKQFTQLRQKIKTVGGEIKVAKITLLHLALKDLDKNLTGPTLTMFAYKDELAPIKALYEFSQENELPKIKLGFFGNKFISKDEVISLAQLPSLEVLQGKLVNILNAPISGLVYSLKANLTKLVMVLEQIRSKKELSG